MKRDDERDSGVGRASARPGARESSKGGLKPALPSDDEQTTGLPGLHTWRSVYVFVLGCFVFYVVALTVFGRYFA